MSIDKKGQPFNNRPNAVVVERNPNAKKLEMNLHKFIIFIHTNKAITNCFDSPLYQVVMLWSCE